MGKGLERLFRQPLAYFPEAEWLVGSHGFGCVEDIHGVVRAASREEQQDFLAWHPPDAPNGYFLEDDLRQFVVGLNRKTENRH